MILLSLIISLLLTLTTGLVHWPTTGISQCKPCTIAYDSYSSGMKVAGLILPGEQNITTLIDLPPQCSKPNGNGTFNFILNIPGNTQVALQVIDNDGGVTVTPFLTVQMTTIKTCLAPAYTGGNITYTTSGVVPSSTIIASGSAYNPDNYTNLSTGAIVGIAIGATAETLTNQTNTSPSPFNTNSNSSTAPFYPSSSPTSLNTTGRNYDRFSSTSSNNDQQPTFSSNNGMNNVAAGERMGTGGLEAPDRFAFRGSTGSNGSENEVGNSVNDTGTNGGGTSGSLGRFPAEGMTPLPR